MRITGRWLIGFGVLGALVFGAGGAFAQATPVPAPAPIFTPAPLPNRVTATPTTATPEQTPSGTPQNSATTAPAPGTLRVGVPTRLNTYISVGSGGGL